jgi:hypothetical protein
LFVFLSWYRLFTFSLLYIFVHFIS